MYESEVLFSLHQFTCTSLVLKLSKSDKKCRKYGQYFIYTPNCSIAFTVSIFLNLINVQWHYVKKFCIDFHWKWSRNVETTDRYSLMPSHTTWLSLCRFSLNSSLLDKFLYRTPVPNFMQIWQTIQSLTQGQMAEQITGWMDIIST